MKPKLDWVHAKFQELRKSHRDEVPENAPMMVTVVYDLLRIQRNELGHPRETPPSLSRDDALANLRVFPAYYAAAEAVRSFLGTVEV